MGTKRARRAALALAVLAGGCTDTFAPHVPEEEEPHGVTARARMEVLTEHPTTVRVTVVLHNEGTTPAIYHYCTLRARVYWDGARRPSYDEVPYFGCTFGRGRITIAPGQRVRLRPRPSSNCPPSAASSAPTSSPPTSRVSTSDFTPCENSNSAPAA